jgi:hypothetical protein
MIDGVEERLSLENPVFSLQLLLYRS